MSSKYEVKPASGDSTAAAYSTASTANFVRSIKKGTTVNVISASGGWSRIQNPNYYSSQSTTRSVNTKLDAKVVSSTGLYMREKNSNTSKIINIIPNGSLVVITDNLPSPLVQITYNKMVGYVDNKYLEVINQNNRNRSGEPETLYMSSNDLKAISTGLFSFITNIADSISNTIGVLTGNANNTISNEDYYLEFARRIGRSYGVPPKFNVDVDPQYTNTLTPGWGRIFSKTLLSNPSILSICPGKVKMFPDLIGTRKDDTFSALIDRVDGNPSLVSKLNQDESSLFSGQMYSFEPDTYGFAKRLNLIARATVMMLGIGEDILPYTSTKLKDMDYMFWNYRERLTRSSSGDTSIFRDSLAATLQSSGGAISDSNYIHFFVSNSETGVSEEISTETGPNSLIQQTIGTLNTTTATLNYFLGSGFNDDSETTNAINAIIGGSGSTSQGLVKLGEDLLKGGQMVFPDQMTATNFGQSYNCEVTFLAPTGSPLAVFMHCILPTLNILTCSLPKQLSDNMYTFPHIVRVCQKGLLNSNLAVITGVNVTRGGAEQTSWTRDGLATEWTVSFSVKPLISQLILTSTDNPYLFIKNDGLIDYLGNLCAFDLKANNIAQKSDFFFSTVASKYTGLPNDLGRAIGDKVAGALNGLFQF